MNRRDLWKAPEDDGGVLVDPPLERAEQLVEINRRRLEGAKTSFGGFSLTEIRSENRFYQTFLLQGTPDDRSRPETYGQEPLVISGHQPELFHPGVWIKNYAINGLARQLNGIPLYVVTDNDVVKSSSLTVPIAAPDPTHVQTASLSFDRLPSDVPWEFAEIRTEDYLFRFGDRLRDLPLGWSFQPILFEFWRRVARAAQKDRNVGRVFASARREWEHRWGCRNLEVTLSAACQSVGFLAFAFQLLVNLPSFHVCHNEQLRTFRRKHRIRSRHHPVADLGAHDNWLEAPFWLENKTECKRGRLFCRSRSDIVELADESFRPVVHLKRDDLTSIYETPNQDCSWQIRPRALTTTMFLRLCVADLFIHGIGGAKYDELTDDIIRRYFGIEPPEYMVVSGTLRLPFEDKLFPRFGCWNRRRKARDVLWNPERYILSDNPNARQLIMEKHRWIEQEPADSAGRRERFYQLHNLTMRLREYVTDEQKEAEADLQRCEAEVAANKILTNREYSFVLYPEVKLRPFLTQFLK